MRHIPSNPKASPFFFKDFSLTRTDLSSIVSDDSDDAIYGLNFEGIVESWNDGAVRLFGYSAEEMIGQPVNMLIPPNAEDDFTNFLEETGRGNRIEHYETVRLTKARAPLHVSLTVSPVRDSFGHMIGVSEIARDITERIQMEEQENALLRFIKKEKAKLEEILAFEDHINKANDLNKLIDWVVEITARVLEADKCSIMLLDEEANELSLRGSQGLDTEALGQARSKVGEPIAGLVVKQRVPVLVEDIETDPRFLRANRSSYRTKSFMSVPVFFNKTILGVVNVADKNSIESIVFNPLDLKILSMVVRQFAIALENAKLYRELKYLTVTDELTQMYNYRHLMNCIDMEIKRSKRYGHALTLIMIDIDDFKSYNDDCGRLAGDAFLKGLSETLRTQIRDIDIACRYAGDEFVIVLPETDTRASQGIANKIQTLVGALAGERKVTVSLGLAGFSPGMDRHEFLRKADSALYHAKKEGRGKIYINP